MASPNQQRQAQTTNKRTTPHAKTTHISSLSHGLGIEKHSRVAQSSRFSTIEQELRRSRGMLARSCHVFFRSNEASPKENAGGVIHQSRQVAASYLRTSRLFASSDNIPAIGDPRASGTTVNNTFLCKKSRRLAHFLARFCCTELSRPSHH
ncbi:hypothetical protein Ae201684P_014620 [Aphanomyces euteiches]|nr:hypothetical protein Ae201684P_014620 [Aphanomyces euteiches]